MSEWHTIGSAPLDYSWQVVAKFTDAGQRLWWERARWNVRAGAWKTAGGACNPTHWLPLPPLEPTPLARELVGELEREVAE